MRTSSLAAIALLLGGVPAQASGDGAAGKAIAESQCKQCHGVDGQRLTEDAPNLSGQNRKYMRIQLFQFRSGERPSDVMTDVASRLSDQDIFDVAEWYGSVGVEVRLPADQ
ncbi:MAG: cytochrome c [Rhizobiaceae bacterium]